MFKTITLLDKSPAIYQDLLRALQKKFLTDDLYDGSYCANRVLETGYKYIGETYNPVNISDFKPATTTSLDDFF
jgi:hypothetical protein